MRLTGDYNCMNCLSRILIIRFSSLGDIVLTTPFIRALKQRFPSSTIDYVAKEEYVPLIAHDPGIDHVYFARSCDGFKGLLALAKKLRRAQYDHVFDLHNNLRSRMLRTLLAAPSSSIRKENLKKFILVSFHKNLFKETVPVPERYARTATVFGVRLDESGPTIHVPSHVYQRAIRILESEQARSSDRSIALCPGARHFTKKWPLEKWIELAGLLLENKDTRIHLFGSKDESSCCDEIQRAYPDVISSFCGKLSLLETAAGLADCDAAVTNDSGLMHLATAVNVPVVSIFGSTVREFGFFPYRSRAVVVEKDDLSCRPCTHIGRKRCPRGHFACLNDITPRTIVQAIDDLLKPDSH
ncbi:MAG: lipopolysaccharide heptosyltransferase II [Chlorobi bacterium]|nr:lipopolysaccharide heptosyltransferase II [Chlorobiota bacterium]